MSKSKSPNRPVTERRSGQKSHSSAEAADVVEVQIQFNGKAPLTADCFHFPDPAPGFTLQVRDLLLDAEEDVWETLGASKPLQGTLTAVATICREPTPDYQNVVDWLFAAAKAAIRHPGERRRFPVRGRGTFVSSVFTGSTEPLARTEELMQTGVQGTASQAESVRSDAQELKKQIIEKAKKWPEEFHERHSRLVELGHAFRSVVAEILQRPLNAAIREIPQSSPQEKQALAVWVNAQLRPLGLAVRCPKSGRASTLVSDTKQGSSEIGRFRLESRDEHGKRVRTWTATVLPELEIMEDVPRAEPLLTWLERTRGQNRPRQRG